MADPASDALSATSGWWRWPLVPVAAVLGATLGAFLFVALQWFSMKLHGGMSEDGWFFLYNLPVIQSAFFGYLYAHITCLVAPRGKVVTGIVMVTLLGVLSLLIVATAWLQPPVETGRAILASVQVVAAMIAAIVSLMSFHEENGWA